MVIVEIFVKTFNSDLHDQLLIT